MFVQIVWLVSKNYSNFYMNEEDEWAATEQMQARKKQTCINNGIIHLKNKIGVHF